MRNVQEDAIGQAALALDEAGSAIEAADAALRGGGSVPRDVRDRITACVDELRRAADSGDLAAGKDLRDLVFLLSGLDIKFTFGAPENIRADLLAASKLVMSGAKYLVEQKNRIAR